MKKKTSSSAEINRNEFLSECFQRDIYLLNIREERGRTDYSQRIGRILEALEGRPYVVCKHNTSDTPAIHALEKCGFRLMSVDATLVLEPDAQKKRKDSKVRGISIEKVGPKDAKRFADLLDRKHRFFDNTHFYMSPFLDDALCDTLYGRWIMKDVCGRTEENYAVMHKGEVAGFVLCFKNNDETIIDLIWVDEELRERGVGTSLILNLAKNNGYGKITTNTQLTNYDALRMYQRIGFDIRKAYAVFHWSRRETT